MRKYRLTLVFAVAAIIFTVVATLTTNRILIAILFLVLLAFIAVADATIQRYRRRELALGEARITNSKKAESERAITLESKANSTTQPTENNNNCTPQMAGGKETILLAEDEPAVRTFIAAMLQNQGYKIIEASNGKEAIKIAEQHDQENIHLLLTDIMMPQMNGIDLADLLKTSRPSTKVLLTSGYPDELIAQETLTHQSYEFIQKPFLPARLFHKIREILDQ